MLISLTIRNIALIEELTLPFGSGLHVLTGETGAGKSIVVDALNLVLGGRADRELIRTGCDKAYVEALFDLSALPGVKELLNREELEAEGNTLALSREISQGGRNICRVCGVIVSLAYLRQLTALLVDVHGQHEHQSLMDEKRHLDFLDRFGNQSHRELLSRVEKDYQAFHENHQEYARLVKENSLREQRMDMLGYQLEELKKARLKPGEEEALQAEKTLLRNGEKIRSAVEAAYEQVYEGTGGERSALAAVKEAADAIGSIAPLSSSYQALSEKLESLYYELEDAGIQLRDMASRDEFDPARADQVEERLDLIKRLLRKYGGTFEEVMEYKRRIALELNELENLDEAIERMAGEHKKLLAAYRRSAKELSQARESLARQFESRMEEQLKDLGMEKTRFSVNFLPPKGDKPPAPKAKGTDEVEFLIAPNPGEPMKPLSKIASGGELSRLMLAIKSIAAQEEGVPVMVFDEIDTGISGRMAQVVAEKMAAIARYRQVVCVTHLPQIAVMADRQYWVNKTVSKERTYTHVKLLNREERYRAAAGMMGGAEGDGGSGVAHAREMMEAADRFKAKFR